MDLSKIQYFIKAAKYENFTKAAKECHIAQTTMTKYIQNLEKEIGFQLFIRSGKDVSLTEKGKQFYSGITVVNEEYLALIAEINKQQRSELHIGIALQEYLDIPRFKEFEEHNSEISLYFQYIQNFEETRALDNGTLDGILVPDALKIPLQYEQVTILNMKQSLIVSKKSQDQYDSIREIVSNLPMITKSNSEEYHSRCIKNFKELYDADLREFIVCSSLTEQLLYISMSKGFGILPYSDRTVMEGLQALPLKDKFHESVQVVYRSTGIRREMEKFLKFIHEKK